MIALRAPMSGLFMAAAGIMLLIALFLRSKKPHKTFVALFLICALIWGVQYSMFLLATLTGILVSYISIYFKRD